MSDFVVLFPNDDERTLETVLRRTGTGAIISSPMADRLLVCSSEVDAVFIRCGLDLLPACETMLLVPVNDQPKVTAWLTANGLAQRCEWRALEHFEFLSIEAGDRLIDVFREVTGEAPFTLPLTLWPDVFRQSVPAA